jgi:hypothetical protein
MFKPGFTLIMCLLVCCAVAQQTNKPKLMIIPYAMNLHLSDMDDEIVQVSGYTSLQVTRETRIGAEKSVYLAGANLFDINTLANVQDDSVVNFLDGVHKSVSYDYKLVPVPEDIVLEDNKAKKAMAKTLGKLKGFARKLQKGTSESDESREYASIKDGQIIVEQNKEERFMSTKVLNPTLFEQMNDFSEQQYFLFLNQLNTSREMINDYSTGHSKRVLKAKLHYSLFNAEGKLLEEGAAISYDKAQIKLKQGYYHILFPSLSHQFEQIFNKLSSAQTE